MKTVVIGGGGGHGGGHWGGVIGGVTTMKRCDEDCGHWAVDHWRGWGGGHWRGWWSLGGGGCSRGGGWSLGVPTMKTGGENAKNEEEEDHSKDRR